MRARMKIAASFAALLVAMTSGAAQARTLHLIIVAETGLTVVDSDSMKQDGDYADGWVSVFRARKYANGVYMVRSHLRFDCVGARWQMLETQSYDRTLARVGSEAIANPPWTDVLPDTNLVPEIKAICFLDYGEKKKPLPPATTDRYLLDLTDRIL